MDLLKILEELKGDIERISVETYTGGFEEKQTALQTLNEALKQVKNNGVSDDVMSVECKKCHDRGIVEDYLGNRSTCECHYS